MPTRFDLGAQFVRTATYEELEAAVADGDSPVVLRGARGSGKSTLMHALAEQFRSSRPVLLTSLLKIVDSDDLVGVLQEWLLPRQEGPDPHSDTRGTGFAADIGAIVSAIEREAHPPLILLDDWHELRDRERVDRIIYRLARGTSAQIVLSSSNLDDQLRRLSPTIITIKPFTVAETERLFVSLGVRQAEMKEARAFAHLSGGSPLILQLALSAHMMRRGLGPSLTLERFVRATFDSLRNSTERTVALAAAILRRPLTFAEIDDLKTDDRPFKSSILHRASGEVGLTHSVLREPILAAGGLLPPPTVCLRDLRFGAEEAERDSLLKSHFVDLPGFEEVVSEGKRIVVGDRGAGKSAMFAHLIQEAPVPEDGRHVRVVPLDHPSDLLRKLETKGEQLTTADEFRAGWLTLFAYACAMEVKSLGAGPTKRVSSYLIRMLSPGTRSMRGLLRQTLDWVIGLSIKITLGPIAIEPKVGGLGLRRASIDLSAFIEHVSKLFTRSGLQLLIPVDRIDEIHKYDRAMQEKVVQGLFLAESQLAQTPNISPIIFIRSDLFATYDIQEKNKLISRRVILNWSKQTLVDLAINRVLSNPELAGLRSFVESIPRMRLELGMCSIFPGEVEGLPIEEWLWRSMENGNGDVTARQVILLLTLATQAPGFADERVGFPIFPPGSLRSAMNALSESSFRELIDDFRVAPTFLANSRAGNLIRFSPENVKGLFEPDEGPRNVQVDLLVRLGFLKRIITQNREPTAEFEVPPLYTRAWTTTEGRPV